MISWLIRGSEKHFGIHKTENSIVPPSRCNSAAVGLPPRPRTHPAGRFAVRLPAFVSLQDQNHEQRHVHLERNGWSCGEFFGTRPWK